MLKSRKSEKPEVKRSVSSLKPIDMYRVVLYLDIYKARVAGEPFGSAQSHMDCYEMP